MNDDDRSICEQYPVLGFIVYASLTVLLCGIAWGWIR